MSNILKGEVTYRVYYNPETLYSVYRVSIEDVDSDILKDYKTCSVSGYFQQLEIGISYTFTGQVKESPKYGFTFVADIAEKATPTTKVGILQFLSSDSFRGIGKKTAENIVNTLGDNCLELIGNDKNVLKKVKGLKQEKIDLIYKGVIDNCIAETILVELYSYGLTPKMSMTLYEKYLTETLNVVKENPYKLIDDIDGIAFIKADKIAMLFGFDKKSQSRIEACIKYTLKSYSNETGNTFIDKDQLVNICMKYLDFGHEERYLIDESINNLILKKCIIFKDNTLSDISLYFCERSICNKLMDMSKIQNKQFNDEEIELVIKQLEDETGIFYEDDQKLAIKNAINNNVSIITGGPGTGKTTIEKGIIYCYKSLVNSSDDGYRLCAPTGKASKRIEESTGYRAQTIHKTLGCDLSGHFTYNMYYPLNINLLIIDETSMVDTYLFKHLLEALNDNTKIVIVGDSDQLPSIGPGQVLRDLINSNCFLVTKLNKIHRQKRNSKIISLAYDVLNENITTELDPQHDELSYVETNSFDLIDSICFCINHFQGRGYSILNDIQVLVPIYKGNVGIDIINKRLQQIYNPNAIYEEEDEIKYFIDDKVIQLVNQYEDGVMNGDMGVVIDKSNDKELIVDFQGNQVKYTGGNISNLSLAYSISIHKSQGSEFKVVILPLFRSYGPLLSKKLIYTAITRAKDYLILVGETGIIERSMKINSKERDTRLKDMIIEKNI